MMYPLYKLTWSTVKMFFRNKQALFFTFFSPLLIMVVFGLIGLDRAQKTNVGIAITAPPSVATKSFVEQLKQVPSFNITEDTEPNLRQKLLDDDLAAAFILPPDLMPVNPANGGSGREVVVLSNTGQAQQAGIAVSIMNEVLNRTALDITGGSDLFRLNVQEVSTEHLKYIDFLLPGLIALSLMQMSIFSVAFVFTNYKEKGVLKRLIATPMRPFTFVTANVVTRLIVSFLQTAIFIAVGVLYLKAHVVGSYWLIGLITVFGSLMFLGLGFTISGIAKTQESVPAFANLIAFPMLFLGGTFFPIESFPTWLKNFATYLPLQFLSDAFRQVMTKNASLWDIRADMLWMLGWSVVLVFFANWAFSFEEKRQ